MEKENMDLNMQGHVEDESPVSCGPKYNIEVGQANISHLGFPDLRWDFGKINIKLPLVVDIKRPEVDRRFSNTHESCSCSSRLIFQDHINVINTDRAVAPICVDIAEVNSDSLHILCKTGSLSNSPLKTTSSRYIFRSLRPRRRARSFSNLSDSIAESSLAVLSGNAVTSPASWMHQSTHVSSKGNTFVSGELLSKALIVDTIKEQDKSISATGRDDESSDLLTFPSRNFCLLSENPKLSDIPFTRRRSDAATSPSRNFCLLSENPKLSDIPFTRRRSDAATSRQLLLSHSSTDSTFSYCSTSSDCCLVKSAIIRCVWKNNVPCFLLSSDDGQGDVYMARPIKVKCPTSENLDYIYLFHSWDKNQVPTASHIAGKMKVSSSLYLDSNGLKSTETEFVLFASNDECISKKQKSSSLNKTGGISGKVAEMFRSSLSSNSKQTINASDYLYDDKCHDIIITEETGTLLSIADERSPNLELAAIVVKDNEYDSTKVAAFRGWGLKFLEKVEIDNDNSQTRSFPSAKSRQKSLQNVNVLVPTGLHGGPAGINSCPSSLLERWRSNGHCDCGGWDIGCPLKILRDASNTSKVLRKKKLQLFLEGAKQVEPQFELLNLTDDMYTVHFQRTLSALQSFAIAIAIIHSRTPDLYSTVS